MMVSVSMCWWLARSVLTHCFWAAVSARLPKRHHAVSYAFVIKASTSAHRLWAVSGRWKLRGWGLVSNGLRLCLKVILEIRFVLKLAGTGCHAHDLPLSVPLPQRHGKCVGCTP